MADFSTKPWDGGASNYDTAQDYCDACLINENDSPRSQWTKANCKLPYKEPNGGPPNVNGIHSAAGALAGAMGGVKAKPASKKAAAKKLISLYGQMKQNPPQSIKNMAM